MSSADFHDWLAYDHVTGRVSGSRTDYSLAIIADVVARTMGGVEDSKLSDWIPEFAYTVHEIPEDMAIAQAKGWFHSLQRTQAENHN